MKRPAFQFYPADWRKDLELQSCSIGARGLWVELCCVMHEAEPYGHLTLNGVAMPDEKAARAVRVELREYRKLLAEIEESGTSSRTPDGVLYSRRMVKDEATRNARAEGGKHGAEHGQKGAEHGAKGGRPRAETGGEKPPLQGEDEGGKKPPLNPPPSSSASSASSSASENPAVETLPALRAGANGSHGRVKKSNDGTAPESWRSPAWISATAQTLGMQRRTNETDADFADRLYTEVNTRRAQAAADAGRRGQ